MNNEKQSSSSAFVQYVINRCSNDKDTGFRAVMRRADNPNQCSAAGNTSFRSAIWHPPINASHSL